MGLGTSGGGLRLSVLVLFFRLFFLVAFLFVVFGGRFRGVFFTESGSNLKKIELPILTLFMLEKISNMRDKIITCIF